MSVKQQAMTLWGLSLRDYQAMFDLTDDDLTRSIIDIGAGPTSFNGEMREQGYFAASSHELYQLPVSEIIEQVTDIFNEFRDDVMQNPDQYVWSTYQSEDEFSQAQEKAKQILFSDIKLGLDEGRYLPYDWSNLNIVKDQFDLALCGNIYYNQPMTEPVDAYVNFIKSLCDATGEVRFFPVMPEAEGVTSLLGPIMMALQMDNYGVEVKKVNYELQKGANAMMRVWATQCQVQ